MQFEIEFETPPKQHRPKTRTSAVAPDNAQMVRLDQKPSDRPQTTLEKRFHKLWKQLENKQLRNTDFETIFEKARTYIQTELNENRVAYHKALFQQTEKLIGHLKKKSLAKWQRAELSDWITQNFSMLEMYGAEELHALSAQFLEAKMSQFTDAEKSIIENELNMSIEEFAATINDLDAEDLDEPDEFDSDFFDEFFEEEPAKDDSRYYREDDVTDSDQHESRRNHESRAYFDKTILNKLFRRAAKALHPDHEPDPVAREEKLALMKVLLQARKSGDIATIFKLYSEHVSADALEFEAPALKPMIELLLHQIENLDLQYKELIFQSPTHQWVSDHMVGKSEKQQSKALLTIKQDIETDLKNIQSMLPHLKSLAKLKPLLEARYEQSRFAFSAEFYN